MAGRRRPLTRRRAVAGGLRDVSHMRGDTDLDPLREREDFRLLMLDLAPPASPVAMAAHRSIMLTYVLLSWFVRPLPIIRAGRRAIDP
jgi:hypothetical protein